MLGIFDFPFFPQTRASTVWEEDVSRCYATKSSATLLPTAFYAVESLSPKQKSTHLSAIFVAEKKRFELLNRFWRLRDFQSRALDQTRRLLHKVYIQFQVGGSWKPMENKTISSNCSWVQYPQNPTWRLYITEAILTSGWAILFHFLWFVRF